MLLSYSDVVLYDSGLPVDFSAYRIYSAEDIAVVMIQVTASET